jgi:hypothetical protein
MAVLTQKLRDYDLMIIRGEKAIVLLSDSVLLSRFVRAD